MFEKCFIILLVVLLIIYLLININEGYQIVENDKITSSSELPKINIKEGSEPLEGELFRDVIMYKNDGTLLGELGLEKCIKKCDGMCVEFGQTGEAFCFPKNYLERPEFIETIPPELRNRLE